MAAAVRAVVWRKAVTVKKIKISELYIILTYEKTALKGGFFVCKD